LTHRRFLDQFSSPIGVGTHADLHPRRAPLASNAVGEGDHSELGHGVADIASDALSGKRTQIDDPPRRANGQMGQVSFGLQY
jgi:hypothetical protein